MGVQDLDVQLIVSQDNLTPKLIQLQTVLDRGVTPAFEKSERAQQELGRTGVSVNQRLIGSLQRLKDRMEQNSLAIQGFRDAWQMAGDVLGKVRQGMAAVGATIRAAAAERTGIVELSSALQRFGQDAERVEEQVEALARQQQRLTRFGDTTTRRIATLFATASQGLQITGRDLVDAVRLIEDIMQRTGRSAEELTNQIAQMYGGNLEAINALLPGQRERINLLREEEGATVAAVEGLEALRQAYRGAAEDLDPYDQALAEASNSLTDLKEKVGEGFLIIASGARTLVNPDFYRDIGRAIDGTQPHINALREELDHLMDVARAGPTDGLMVGGAQWSVDTVQSLQNVHDELELGAEDLDVLRSRVLAATTAFEELADAGADAADQASRFGDQSAREILEERLAESGWLDENWQENFDRETERLDREEEQRRQASQRRRDERQRETEEAERARLSDQDAFNVGLMEWQDAFRRREDLEREHHQRLREAEEEATAERADVVIAAMQQNFRRVQRMRAADREARTLATRAEVASAIGEVSAIARAAGPLFENKKQYAGVMGLIETAEAMADYASLNIPGGVAHTLAAAAYFKAATAAGKSGGGGGGGGGGGVAPRVAAVSTAPPPQAATGGTGGAGRGEVHIHLEAPMLDPYRAGRDAAQALSRYAQLDNGDRIDSRLLDGGRARGL